MFALREWEEAGGPPGPAADNDLPPPYGPGAKKEPRPGKPPHERRPRDGHKHAPAAPAAPVAPVASGVVPDAVAPEEIAAVAPDIAPDVAVPDDDEVLVDALPEINDESDLAPLDAEPEHDEPPADDGGELPGGAEDEAPEAAEPPPEPAPVAVAVAVVSNEPPPAADPPTQPISEPPATAAEEPAAPEAAPSAPAPQEDADGSEELTRPLPIASPPAAPEPVLPAFPRLTTGVRPSGGRMAPPPRPVGSLLGDEQAPPAPDEVLRADLAAGAIEVFGEEEDDDQPILGGEPASEQGGGRRRRRRRRRGGEGARPEVDAGLPSYTVSPAFGDAAEARPEEARREEPRRPEEGRREGRGEPRGEGRGEPRGEPRGEGRSEPRSEGRGEPRAERGEGRGEPRGEGRGEPRGEGRGEPRGERGEGRGEPRGERGEEAFRGEARADGEKPIRVEGDGDELVGRDLVDVLLNALGGFERGGGPVPLRSVAETLVRRGRIAGDPGQVVSMLAAAARADNLRRSVAGQRPRFRLSNGRVALTDWSLNQELLRLEGEALASIERYRDASRKALARKLGELPGHAFVEVAITLLERLGVSQLKAVKRQGGGGETHLSGVQRGPGGESRVAVVIRKDAREINRERVTEVRGSLHHYGPATAAWLLTSGQVLSGAREEAQASSAAPVYLLDGLGVAKLCEEHGLGVIRTTLSVALPDLDFFEALRGA